ncbi:MAG: type II toxin-antitoxin system RelE/ParE family toxin [Treponema sp.]|jgi:mRNA interferase RelE/StbE|nr:type II toxin-antitoxin system RelE/ParE family toxin [Treponema sp.]
MKASLHPIADKYLNRLNANDRDRIDDAIEGLEKEPPEGDIRPVTGQPGLFRMRVGNYRLLYRINEKGILITHIDPRGQVYKKKNKGGKR